mmetsp:Transcript_11163/g.22636  ORF Transcript_11163/g.22636 Transcript_11163/m.22636 type:complete len:215 (-) Transcript_11163:98-742(-)
MARLHQGHHGGQLGALRAGLHVEIPQHELAAEVEGDAVVASSDDDLRAGLLGRLLVPVQHIAVEEEFPAQVDVVGAASDASLHDPRAKQSVRTCKGEENSSFLSKRRQSINVGSRGHDHVEVEAEGRLQVIKLGLVTTRHSYFHSAHALEILDHELPGESGSAKHHDVILARRKWGPDSRLAEGRYDVRGVQTTLFSALFRGDERGRASDGIKG